MHRRSHVRRLVMDRVPKIRVLKVPWKEKWGLRQINMDFLHFWGLLYFIILQSWARRAGRRSRHCGSLKNLLIICQKNWQKYRKALFKFNYALKAIFWVPDLSLFTGGHCKTKITGAETTEGCPVNPGSTLNKVGGHSSEIRCLCFMKWPSKTLQNLPYVWNTKTHMFFFKFSFHATLHWFFINECSGKCWHRPAGAARAFIRDKIK